MTSRKQRVFFDNETSSLIARQPCPWDITLDRVLETEIDLEEKPKLDHSFVSRITVLISLLRTVDLQVLRIKD